MPFERILVVDDELVIRKTMADALRSKRYSVVTAGSIAEAEKLLQRDKIDLMFLDIRLPDGDGVDFLEQLSNAPERPLTIMMSGFGTIETAVTCMRFGAFDYLMKPFTINAVEAHLEKAAAFSQVLKVNRSITQKPNDSAFLIGESQPMLHLKELIHKVAPTEATVLICGENGTGKELVANDICTLSARAAGPYIKINCAAISETLIESEFFGHEKGAYTGATDRREGRFELANGGTLLLDEISEIPSHLQAKLLRVLQEREFERVGGSKTIKVDVRVLATTNRDLKKEVASGKFREDLYYRLNVFPLYVPALRDRGADVQMLAKTFLNRSSKKYGFEIPGFSLQALESMIHYHWPGNVRELQNCIERAVILSNNTPIHWEALGLPSIAIALTSPVEIATIALPVPATGVNLHSPLKAASNQSSDSEVMPLPQTRCVEPKRLEVAAGSPPDDDREEFSAFVSLEELEKEHILRALEITNGNRTHAANLLKISIRTLRNKLNEYKLSEATAGNGARAASFDYRESDSTVTAWGTASGGDRGRAAGWARACAISFGPGLYPVVARPSEGSGRG